MPEATVPARFSQLRVINTTTGATMQLTDKDRELAAQFAGGGDGLEAAPTSYRDMTEEQRLAWGAAEAEARKADLAVRGADGLRKAQENAETRRKAIGASKSWAASAVIVAQRASRIASARSA